MPAQTTFRYLQQQQMKALEQIIVSKRLYDWTGIQRNFIGGSNLQILNERYLNQSDKFLSATKDALKKAVVKSLCGFNRVGNGIYRNKFIQCVGNAGSKILLAHHKQFYMKPIHFEIDNTAALSYLLRTSI